MKLRELKDYIPVIITRNTYNDLNNQIKRAEDETSHECYLRNQMQKKYELLQKDFNEFEITVNKEIEVQKHKIDKLTETLSLRNQALEEVIKEKEEYKIKIHELQGAKGGYTKEINKLNAKIDTKEKVIEEYKLALKEAENKNKVQLEKIQELTKTKEHTIEEYKHNGLRKNMKKKRGNKNEK